jgi:CHAT domain-containing protein
MNLPDSVPVQIAQGRDRPRLWWVPTGTFLFLPVHAAGIYAGPSPLSLSDFAISSYSPNLGQLIDARGRLRTVRKVDARVLLIAQPNASGFDTLPNTTIEADEISGLLPPTALILPGQSPSYDLTVGQTLDACPQSSILHLACHGQQDSEDALESGFFLRDGKLTVSALMQLNLPDAFFAFLSACESAKGDVKQPDEVISLSAAMMFAGFKSVIGTMW